MKAKNINIIGLREKQLMDISRKGILSLSLEEMKTIQSFFKKIGREPTDLEIETIAQTWSEHCFHKTFKSRIEYTEIQNGKSFTEGIPSLFFLIRKATEKISKDWCLSVFKDNAGIIEFDKNTAIAFKIETHNHPSAIEPYGGAETGLGGVIRDILGAGLGAKPIFNTDVFCFGPLQTRIEDIPSEILHPKRLFRGVVSGVRDYGNRMGIPTGNGAIIFDEEYLYNILVYCGTLGIMPKKFINKKVSPGELIIVIGGKTGKDGIHGATFSSASLEKNIPTSVVQIGNAITEKKMLDALLTARDKGLISSITDCGAGGLSSSVGELAQDCGAKVFLEKVPLKYFGLQPWEIWLSESQERMVLSVKKKNFPKIKKIFENEDVEYACIGEFTDTGHLELLHNNDIIGNIDCKFLFSGIPDTSLDAVFTYKTLPDIFPENIEPSEILINLLADCNIASKETVIRQYDHEVQSRTILKPLSGVDNCGPMDAAVLKPLYNSNRGIVVGCGINPYYGKIDPYIMAGCCIEEALRNIISVGGDIEKTALLDNFCWGNINDKYILGGLARCVKGCHDFSIKYDVPFISGKDSLNNYYTLNDGRIFSIPGTLLISAVSVIEDVTKIISSDFKEADSFVYVLGITKDEFGGSHLYKFLKLKAGKIPQVYPEISLSIMKKLHKAIKNGIIKACHDCSEGGFAVALSEMVIGGGYGARVDIKKMPRETDKDISLLFSESQGRFIVEVDKNDSGKFEKMFSGLPFFCIGNTIPDFRINIFSEKEKIIDIKGEKIKAVWTGALKW